MKLWLLLLMAGLAASAVASADLSNDDINAKVGDDHHGGGHHDHNDDNNDDEAPRVVNRDRACPEGFFYAGEPSALPENQKEERWQVWDKGPTSPVYSCYAFLKAEKMSFAGASLGCNQMSGQLVSINQILEEEILVGEEFIANFRHQDTQGDSNPKTPMLTSGLYLGEQNWTWFGADEPIAEDLVANWTVNSTQLTDTQCLTISWVSEKQGDATIRLHYKPVSCLATFDNAICEVRVYTQTWYVWFYVNWLQILFFFTLTALILASCCIFQSWLFRPTRRQGGVVQGQMNHVAPPPPYTQYQQYAAPQNRASAAAANYVRKGREILAKVTFYKPAEEKRPLA